jgi:hypothetical protein
MDVGEIEQDGRQKPFFVMPLLEGATLAERPAMPNDMRDSSSSTFG